jgi:hypothetical protein
LPFCTATNTGVALATGTWRGFKNARDRSVADNFINGPNGTTRDSLAMFLRQHKRVKRRRRPFGSELAAQEK